MKRRSFLIASVMAGSVLVFAARAAPPEGKGQGKNANFHGNKGKGAKNSNDQKRSAYYDSHGRDHEYFDDRRDKHGRLRGDESFADLVYAGITAALAKEYVYDLGLTGYSALPPGIRKNLARGKPLPPGIAKKTVPGSLLGRLPRYPGYEWRVTGTDLILVSIATAAVADILYDVFN